MTAYGYIRISQEDQSTYSIDSQERYIREYCIRYNLVLKQIFTDNGESSYTFDRAEFNKLQSQIKADKAKYIVVYHLDRFSRNMAEAMLKIKELFAKGIYVRDISEPVDLDDEDPNTFLLRAMKFMSAESELHRIRQRTKSGMLQAALNGRHANMAPVGYTNERDQCNKPVLEIDTERAAMVRLIFREYINGASIEEIRRLCRDKQYKITGNSSVQRILGNQVYAGFVKIPGSKDKSPRWAKGLHAPIISEQDYWLAQSRLNGKTIHKQDREEVPLRGALHCWCGRFVTAGNSKGRRKYYWYYLCQEHRKSLPAKKLHDQFNDLLGNLSFDPLTTKWFKDQLGYALGEYLNNRGEKIQDLEKRLKMVENQIKRAGEKYLLMPAISEEAYKSVMTGLKTEEYRLHQEIAGLHTNQQAYWDNLHKLLFKLSDLRSAFEVMDLQRKHEFINLVFNNNLFYENGSYRTHHLHDLFSHNLPVLNEKGLLSISSPVIGIEETPNRTLTGNIIEHLDRLFKIFVA